MSSPYRHTSSVRMTNCTAPLSDTDHLLSMEFNEHNSELRYWLGNKKSESLLCRRYHREGTEDGNMHLAFGSDLVYRLQHTPNNL